MASLQPQTQQTDIMKPKIVLTTEAQERKEIQTPQPFDTKQQQRLTTDDLAMWTHSPKVPSSHEFHYRREDVEGAFFSVACTVLH